MAYYRLEPWGPERADLNAAIIASTIANCHRDSKTKPEPYKPSDFIVEFGKEPDEQQPEDGMSGEHVMAVMERLRSYQERRARAGFP